MQLTIVRHGETKSNKQKIIQGQLNTDLNAIGEEQALRTGLSLKNKKFNRVIASDLNRAVQTAELIMRSLTGGLQLETTASLRELDHGSYQGESKDQFDWAHHSQTVRVGGGESIEDLYQRVADFFNKLLRDCEPSDSILIVTHRGVVAAFNQMHSQRGFFTDSIENSKPYSYELVEPLHIPSKMLKTI